MKIWSNLSIPTSFSLYSINTQLFSLHYLFWKTKQKNSTITRSPCCLSICIWSPLTFECLNKSFWNLAYHYTWAQLSGIIHKFISVVPTLQLLSLRHYLTLYSQYTHIYSTLMFVVKHKDIFKVHTEVHRINIRQKLDLHVPSTRLTRIQKGLYYSGITLFNALPLAIKQAAHDIKKFKHILKIFHFIHFIL
jgi:hypothetical protein